MTTKEDQKIIDEIRSAMDNHELVAFYQPQYDAINQRLVSAEALIRWIKPDGSMVSPGYFIPVLEKGEEILSVDWYMLEEVCKMLRKMIDSGAPYVPIAVNFSRMHILMEPDFVAILCGIADKYNVNHNLIEVEITESVLANMEKEVAKFVADVRAQGFTVAIDDFGSGVSSLSFVKDVDVDVLKVDRSLLSHNCDDAKERVVLESIFMFCNRLKLTTVAEGVETEQQLSFLRTCNCDKIQGFIYAKPMPQSDFMAACGEQCKIFNEHDIITTQSYSSSMELLGQAIFSRYDLIIFINLTRDSFFFMTSDKHKVTHSHSSGVFSEMLNEAGDSFRSEDRQRFFDTFMPTKQLEAYKKGERFIRFVGTQMGNDGCERIMETCNYFVKHPASDDVLAISMSCEISGK